MLGSAVHLVAGMLHRAYKVDLAKRAELEKFFLGTIKKLHMARKDAGVEMGWNLTKVVLPAGEEASNHYISTAFSEKFPALDPSPADLAPFIEKAGSTPEKFRESLFGLGTLVRMALSSPIEHLDDLAADRAPHWPSQTEIATRSGVTRARIGQVVAAGRQRWSRNPSLTEVRTLIHSGSVRAPDSWKPWNWPACCSLAAAPRAKGTSAVCRAALEAERAMEKPRFTESPLSLKYPDRDRGRVGRRRLGSPPRRSRRRPGQRPPLARSGAGPGNPTRSGIPGPPAAARGRTPSPPGRRCPVGPAGTLPAEHGRTRRPGAFAVALAGAAAIAIPDLRARVRDRYP